MNKPVRVNSLHGRIFLVQWLRENDPDFVEVIDNTVKWFGTLEGEFSYLNKDPKKMDDLWMHMNRSMGMIK